MSTKRKKPPVPNLRDEVKRLALNARVDLTAYERATILGQIAGLLLAHPKIGDRIVFKGGAMARLVDGSPRFSKDLDSQVAQTRTRIKADWVRAALTEGADAKRVVQRVEDIYVKDSEGLNVPLIVCNPRSGVGEIPLEFSIKWDEPILRKPEWQELEITPGVVVTLPVMARRERLAEKVSTFLNRGSDRDAFDLHFYATLTGKQALSKAEWNDLGPLVSDKIELDGDFLLGEDLLARWAEKVAQAAADFGGKGNLVVAGELAPWTEVGPSVDRFQPYVPATKEGRAVEPDWP